MAPFAWMVRAETEVEEMKFSRQISLHKVSDDEIRDLIRRECDEHNVKLEANFIFNLTFLAIDENGLSYVESLSPFDFWPIKPMGLYAENKDKFRVTKEGEE